MPLYCSLSYIYYWRPSNKRVSLIVSDARCHSLSYIFAEDQATEDTVSSITVTWFLCCLGYLSQAILLQIIGWQHCCSEWFSRVLSCTWQYFRIKENIYRSKDIDLASSVLNFKVDVIFAWSGICRICNYWILIFLIIYIYVKRGTFRFISRIAFSLNIRTFCDTWLLFFPLF